MINLCSFETLRSRNDLLAIDCIHTQFVQTPGPVTIQIDKQTN